MSLPAPRSRFLVLFPFFIAAMILWGCGDDESGIPVQAVYDTDTTVDDLVINAGATVFLDNSAVLTVTNDAIIDGRLEARDGALNLLVGGNLSVNGTFRSQHSAPPTQAPSTAVDQAQSGIYVVATEMEWGPSAVVSSNGNVVITDDVNELSRTAEDFFDEVDTVDPAGTIPTLVPLPPTDPVFPAPRVTDTPLPPAGVAAMPIVIKGTYDYSAAPGDKPIMVFRFNGNHTVLIDTLNVTGPPGVPGDDDDNSADPNDEGMDAQGGNGRNGMNLNIWNNNGPINIVGPVVFNLSDGAPGGEATAVCAKATGGDGGKSGNFRMSAAGGIDMTNGAVVMNPGRGGDGGKAEVTVGMPGASGCPGQDGASGEAVGGNGADQKKRLYARGNVAGLQNLTVGNSRAGDGAEAICGACNGGQGDPCCAGGGGGQAKATGGKGGDATLDITGLPVTTSGVQGGNGGDATAGGATGGDGGDCKFGPGGNGGSGGAADAASGDGGSASAAGGAGGDVGGNSGNATATGGNGGAGGDGNGPGTGGTKGTATATAGAAGTGGTSGTQGTTDATDGTDGPNGNPVTLFFWCFNYGFLPDGSIIPGVYGGTLFDRQSTAPVGSMDIEFLPGGEYFKQSAPVGHIGYGPGAVDYRVDSIQLTQGEPGEVGGIEIAPLSGPGITPGNPLVVEALNGQGQAVDTQMIGNIPDNQGDPQNPVSFPVFFNTSETIVIIRVTVPSGAFVTFISIYIIDP
jgi:hypothetical protein